jgi:uncharacterized membrane protein YeaQ/YmgE (transglycosylase-associated protein family)
MSPEIIAIVVGLLIGWAADFLLKEGGYGMTADLGLGFGGGLMAVILAQAFGIGVESGWFAMTLVSVTGAAALIGGQRRFWSRPAPTDVRTTRR